MVHRNEILILIDAPAVQISCVAEYLRIFYETRHVNSMNFVNIIARSRETGTWNRACDADLRNAKVCSIEIGILRTKS